MSTAIICVVLLVIIIIGARSFMKRAASGCCGSGDDKKRVKVDKDISHYTYKYVMNIEGMHCNHCKSSVENALNSLDGVYADVDLKGGKALIYLKEEGQSQKLAGAVRACGFTVKDLTPEQK